ncbi:MAG: hypothetical protein M3Y03_03465 [Verrucomicrobiota bacterium]|nr:hypothetical protein [Verrucomicrobiota bacterium]
MPYTTELTQDCLGILHTGSGVVTGAELLAASVAATRLVQNTANFQYEFGDWSAVTEMRVAPEEVERIVAQDRIAARSRPQAIVVLVVPQGESYRLAQAWEEQVRDLGWTIHLARERSEAVQWLTHHIQTERPELLAGKNLNVA